VDRVEAMTLNRRRARELEALYEEILAEYGPVLGRVAASYEFDPALREDLFQEICLAVWKALPRFEGRASLKTFVYRIAHNRGLTHGWRAKGGPLPLEEPEGLRDPAPSPEEAMVRRGRRERLAAAILRLPVDWRQVLTLRLEGLSYEEISEITGVTANGAMVRASRARARLRELLAEGEEVAR
jgi:RNA polymerase sigma-70 factor, ECF subfamily